LNNNYVFIFLVYYRVVKIVIENKRKKNDGERRKEERSEDALTLFSMFLFLYACIDDKKMEKLFSSVPPDNIEKRYRDITIADR
jgi:hypothetical protein